MMDWGLLIVLMMAIALGFLLGRRSHKIEDQIDVPSIEPHYIQGLNYLLHEQSDAAIDTFIDVLDVNNETLETHLALGNLLRKKGEVGRAIKIHQNLLARPTLGKDQGRQIQLELARDFVKAGLLDRAEMLLQELVQTSSQPIRTQCLEHLIDIYRDEKEWRKGIEAITQLSSRRFSRLPDRWRTVQSHFYCELAQQALDKSDYLNARRQLKAAFVAEKQSARASLLLADLEYRLGQYKEAIRALKQVFHQDPLLVPEALPLLTTCYRATGRVSQLKEYLLSLLEQKMSTSVLLAITDILEGEEGGAVAADFLSSQLAQYGSTLTSAERLLALEVSISNEHTVGLEASRKVIQNLQKVSPQYRCHGCGFGGRQMHWVCPGCKSWGSVKPIE